MSVSHSYVFCPDLWKKALWEWTFANTDIRTKVEIYLANQQNANKLLLGPSLTSLQEIQEAESTTSSYKVLEVFYNIFNY